MNKIIIETCGWLGVLAVVSAYALVSFDIILPGSFTYFILNVLGGSGMIISAYPKKAYQPVVLNIIWILIAVVSFAAVF